MKPLKKGQVKVQQTIPKLKKILESNNRTTMKAFRILKGDCSDDIERIHIRIKNNSLFWIHLKSFTREIEELGFTPSWMSRDSWIDQKTQFTLTIVRDRRNE